MGVVEIKQEIEKCESSIKAQQQSFLVQRQQIIDAIKPFVNARLKEEVEAEVKRNSEHTKELGKPALSEMKKRLAELLENSDRITDEAFGDDTIWTYVNYKVLPDGDRFGQGYNNRKAAKENILKGIKIIIGEAGKILLDNKYIKVGGQYRWDADVRYDYTRAGKGATKIVYGYGLSLPQNIEKLIDEYCKGIEDLHETAGKVLDLKEKLSEQEAVDLWDEV
jgi:hypothetical protein